ncbi:MAG: hypothetical protein MJ126_07350 [Lachnospiraceae bacterium]|nr:hypothetical protein [Lachnospiraceae bacterium]
MRKRIYGLALALTLACLVGCTQDNPEVVIDESEIIEDVVDDKDNQPVVLEGGQAPTASVEVNPNYISLNDAGIKASGITLLIGDDFKPNIDIVGEATIVEGQACLDDGFDTNYYYDDEAFVVYTYAQDGKQVIYNIYSESADYVTAKGIKVGSSKEEVLSAYGEPNENVGSSFKYYVEKKDTILSFDFKNDDTVKAVDLLRN